MFVDIGEYTENGSQWTHIGTYDLFIIYKSVHALTTKRGSYVCKYTMKSGFYL